MIPYDKQIELGRIYVLPDPPEIRRIRHPSDVALIAVVVGIAVYDILARDGETISDGVDRYLATRRWPTELATALVYAHVSNKVPDRYDPIHLMFLGIRKLTKGLRHG